MDQISLNQVEGACLTVEQRSAWSRDGFLILKSALSALEVARLASDVGAGEDAGAYQALVQSLSEPAGEILDAEPILLSLRRGVAERFGLDALDAASGPVVGGVTALVKLGPTAGWVHSFFPGSHLIAPEASPSGWGTQMFRIAEEIRSLDLRRETLTIAPGDVWLRHPRLLRGVQRSGAPSERPDWLTAVFGRIDDLPRTRTADGSGYGERPVRLNSSAIEPGASVLGIRAAGG